MRAILSIRGPDEGVTQDRQSAEKAMRQNARIALTRRKPSAAAGPA